MLSLRQRLHLLLWMDEWELLDPARCWSECIRRDFRSMTGERRLKWRAMLKHLRGNAPVKMPAGWARDAAPLLAAAGLEDFRGCIQVWFAAFRSGEPLPLTVAGSHVLKCLIWFCAISKDNELRECALWLLDVKWKQKRNTLKSMLALTAFGITEGELRARNLIKPPAPDPMPRFLEKMSRAICDMANCRIANDPENDVIIVQGQLHFYRLFRLTGRIERVTDNVELEIDWPAVPDQIRLILHRESDSAHQLDLRARFLMHDAAFGRFFMPKPESPK